MRKSVIVKKTSRMENKNPMKLKMQGFRDFFFIRKLGLALSSYGNINWNAGWIIGKTKDVFLSIHMRPKFSKDVKLKSTYKIYSEDLAVILQGPIGGIEQFVEETVKLYAVIFEGAKIIVSTWKGVDSKVVSRLESLGAIVILNDVPNDSGWWNVDLQTKSTSSAISYAKEKNIKYCLKTRVDFRIYKPNSFAYLKSLLDVFPINNLNFQKARLITTSLLTLKYRVYGVTDILMFGTTYDMARYWSSENFNDGLKRCNFGNHPSVINGTPVVTEIFLCARYLHDIGEPLEWSLEHWWEMLRKYFCVIDADSLDLLETKYDCMYEKRFYKSYTLPSSRSVEFSDWLSLYSEKDMHWGDLNLKEEWEVRDGNLRKVRIL
jgi:hypothetical protein